MRVGLRTRLAIGAMALAALGTTAAVVASAEIASAAPTRGLEVLRATITEVNGQGVGPTTDAGVVSQHGVVQEIPSLKTDPKGSSRALIVERVGTFTVLNTGGQVVLPKSNPITCAFSATIVGQRSRVVAGTGLYAHETGLYVDTLRINGFNKRALVAPFKCTAQTLFDTVNVTAVGNINLHPVV
jgi:hypothetical protein